MKKLRNGQYRQAVMSNKPIKTPYTTKSGQVKNRIRYPKGTKVLKYIVHDKPEK